MSQTHSITAGDAILFYHSSIAPKRGQASQPQWKLSEKTVRQIAKSSGIDLDDEDTFPNWKVEGTLCGLPIRIDDHVEGLDVEWLP